MKATLEFELPEEEYEFSMATKGGLYYCALQNIKDELRRGRKHTEQTPADNEALIKAIQAIVNEIELEE